MATSTWTSVLLSAASADLTLTADQAFRIWGKKIHDELVLMSGIVNTADTGQIDWVTVTRPGAISTNAGFQTYYLNDSLHATAPIYFRIDFGTHAGGTSRPRIQLTVGTGTNGAGVLTGTALTATNTTASNTLIVTTTGYTSYLCVTEGFVGFVGWSPGPQADTGSMGFAISRSCDINGAMDGTACTVINHSGAGNTSPAFCQHLRFAATAAAYTRSSTAVPISIPHAELLTAINGTPQAYLAWQHTPYMQPLNSMCGVLLSEVDYGTVFSAALVGSTVRTYINVLGGCGVLNSAPSPSSFGSAMLWE